jgi:pimeloyl-ACP methyl ester carboxylesterase
VSEGRGVLDSVRAAGSLPDAERSDTTLIAGYSQGGHGALWADRLAADWTPELHVVGTFAGAPATELQLIVERPEDVPFDGFVPMLVSGLAASSRYIRPESYLTEAGVASLDFVQTSCLDDVETGFATVDVADLVRPEGPADEAWSAAAAANNPGLEGADDPVLIVHSETDDTIPVALSDLVRERLCAAGQDVERRILHDGSDHVIGAVAAYAEALAWFEARFAGDPTTTSSC